MDRSTFSWASRRMICGRTLASWISTASSIDSSRQGRISVVDVFVSARASSSLYTTYHDDIDVRTYSVVTLNEECGLVEWVNNTIPVRAVLLKYYEQKGIKSWVCAAEHLIIMCLRIYSRMRWQHIVKGSSISRKPNVFGSTKRRSSISERQINSLVTCS
jgi:hypothetical protein